MEAPMSQVTCEMSKHGRSLSYLQEPRKGFVIHPIYIRYDWDCAEIHHVSNHRERESRIRKPSDRCVLSVFPQRVRFRLPHISGVLSRMENPENSLIAYSPSSNMIG
jgi:hypothetical protein